MDEDHRDLQLFFPRTTLLPAHTPLYWVENKDRFLRQLLIRDIEAITNRPLLVYYTNRHWGGSINEDDVEALSELTSRVAGQEFDLLLETMGGETDAAESIVSLLRNTSPNFRTIVANSAKSNGTLVCLASSEVIMGPTSELGPIDPHIEGVPASTLIDTKYSEHPNLQLQLMHEDAKWAIARTKKLATEFLKSGMMQTDQARIKSCVESLLERQYFASHGATIDATSAKALGLKIDYRDQLDEVFSRIWLLSTMYAHDSLNRMYEKIFEDRQASASIVTNAESGDQAGSTGGLL